MYKYIYDLYDHVLLVTLIYLLISAYSTVLEQSLTPAGPLVNVPTAQDIQLGKSLRTAPQIPLLDNGHPDLNGGGLALSCIQHSAPSKNGARPTDRGNMYHISNRFTRRVGDLQRALEELTFAYVTRERYRGRPWRSRGFWPQISPLIQRISRKSLYLRKWTEGLSFAIVCLIQRSYSFFFF